jgi:VanZ family protein
LPRDWPPHFGPGDLVLELGRGGLSDWRVLYENPNSLSAVLLVANVLLYIPLATFGVLGWPRRTLSVFAGCLLLSLLVELAQRAFLDGISSLDDVLLNAGGALIGAILGAGLVRRRVGPARAAG